MMPKIVPSECVDVCVDMYVYSCRAVGAAAVGMAMVATLLEL